MSEIQKDQDKRIKELASKLLKMKQAETKETHRFSHGLYVRELFIPRGVLVIGLTHRQAHWNFFMKGKLSFLASDGKWYELEAPMSFEGKAERKVAIALEDTVWQNCFPNPDNCRDIKQLEERYFDNRELDLKDKAHLDRAVRGLESLNCNVGVRSRLE